MRRSPSAPAMASASCVLPVPGSPRTSSGRSSANAQFTADSSADEVRYLSVPRNFLKSIVLLRPGGPREPATPDLILCFALVSCATARRGSHPTEALADLPQARSRPVVERPRRRLRFPATHEVLPRYAFDFR